jgi:hypothetical protein
VFSLVINVIRKMDIERYKIFSADDFVLDKNFVELVTGKFDPLNSVELLKEELPEKSLEIGLAVEVVKALQSSDEEQPAGRILELWKNVINDRGRQIRLQIFRYAAAVLFAIGIGSSALYIHHRHTSIENFVSSGENSENEATLILADGKKVDISGNK